MEENKEAGEKYINMRFKAVLFIRYVKELKLTWIMGTERVAHRGDNGYVHRVSEDKPKKRQLEKSRHRCKDNIKMYFKETRLWSVDWIDLTQSRNRWWDFVSTVMNFRVR